MWAHRSGWPHRQGPRPSPAVRGSQPSTMPHRQAIARYDRRRRAACCLVLSLLAKTVCRRPGDTEWHGVARSGAFITRAVDVRAQAGVRDLAAYPKLIHFRIPAACVQVEDHERGLRRGRHRCSAAVSAGVHTLGKVADRYRGFKIGGEPRGSGLGCFILSGKPTTRLRTTHT